MRIFRNSFLSLILLTSTTNSLYAQQCYEQECDTTGEAYAQSSYNSHWSAFVPIALIVGAAIWFGVADGNSSSSSSSSGSNSKDGLGSLSRHRSGSSSSGSRSSGSRSSSGSSSSYSSHS